MAGTWRITGELTRVEAGPDSKGTYGPGLGIWVLNNPGYVLRDFSKIIMHPLLLQGIQRSYLILRASI